MIVEIEATHLPGRACLGYDNIHVGLGLHAEPFDLIPGDAPSALWRTNVEIKSVADGLDFRGKFVHGPRGDRYLYLNWGTVAPDGAFTLFRRAKLILDAIPHDLVRRAESTSQPLVGHVILTDRKGNPLCARVKPPFITWTVDRD
jgi:hypothetical protein